MPHLVVQPRNSAVVGRIPVPPSKYHLHRSLILGALAPGTTRIEGRSDARHVSYTVSALRQLGVGVTVLDDGYTVEGGAWRAKTRVVHVGNSGSTLQFLLGLSALTTNGPVVLEGQPQLMRRPIVPLIAGLGSLGIHARTISETAVEVRPGCPHGGVALLPGMLSQWASALLLVAPYADRPVTVALAEPVRERTYVRLTARMMATFGVAVEHDSDGLSWRVPAPQSYRPARVQTPADLSSAAFLLALAALHPSQLELTGVSAMSVHEHPEGQIVSILERMGAALTVDGRAGRIVIRHDGRRLDAVDVDLTDIPDLLPILTVLAATARGTSVLRHVTGARYKESDRVQAMLQLNAMGADVSVRGDDLIVRGVPRLTGTGIRTQNDHRVMMAYTVAATVAAGPSVLSHPRAYRLSYPDFLADLERVWGPVDVTGIKKEAVGL